MKPFRNCKLLLECSKWGRWARLHLWGELKEFERALGTNRSGVRRNLDWVELTAVNLPFERQKILQGSIGNRSRRDTRHTELWIVCYVLPWTWSRNRTPIPDRDIYRSRRLPESWFLSKIKIIDWNLEMFEC